MLTRAAIKYPDVVYVVRNLISNLLNTSNLSERKSIWFENTHHYIECP